MNTTRLIEAYLEGSLENDVAEEIKTRIQNDFEFAELVRLHKEINESIRDEELVNLRHTLAKMNREYDRLKGRSGFPFRKIIRIAAAFLLMSIIVIAVLRWMLPGYSYSAIFEKYYAKYETDAVTRSGQANGMDLMHAQYFYQTNKYPECVELLENLVSNQEENYMALLFLGLAKIELNQPDEAIHYFLRIPPGWENPYSIHRDWYLALCLIKTRQKDQAISLLEKLSVPEGFYSKKAKKILGRITF